MCLLTILVLQATEWFMSDFNSFSTTSARENADLLMVMALFMCDRQCPINVSNDGGFSACLKLTRSSVLPITQVTKTASY